MSIHEALRQLRAGIHTAPLTPDEHHHRRLLELARREREADLLRQAAVNPGFPAIH
ncbi:hypothetical protein [Microbacterium kyungheense]|uniref:Uncharacterized protein n=1 Tax=Microbacterium kyungheense TaxID=1263636 RepID=A0A543FKL7_9MICO|nr:hypothetical protein [Microbacterium kyungheense]TQM34234.1 hypothetical protein FB391_0521 [Microbacterium kyungheense]